MPISCNVQMELESLKTMWQEQYHENHILVPLEPFLPTFPQIKYSGHHKRRFEFTLTVRTTCSLVINAVKTIKRFGGSLGCCQLRSVFKGRISINTFAWCCYAIAGGYWFKSYLLPDWRQEETKPALPLSQWFCATIHVVEQLCMWSTAKQSPPLNGNGTL